MRNILKITLLAFIILFNCHSAYSLSLRLEPFRKPVNCAEPCDGIEFTLKVMIEASSEEIKQFGQIMSAYIQINFDTNFLEVSNIENKEFTIVTDRIIDNKTGLFVFGAGYPGGAKGHKIEFIKISFRTKKSGTTTIKLDRNISKIVFYDYRIYPPTTLRSPDFVVNSTIYIGVGVDYIRIGKPFNPTKDGPIKMRQSLSEDADYIIMRIYTIHGLHIKTVHGQRDKDGLFAEWDGRDNNGNFVPNGVYIYQMEYHSKNKKTFSKPRLIGVLK